MESCGCLSSIARSLCGTKSTQRARYNEQEYTIEFENLIEEEDFYQPSQRIVSDVEKDLLKKGKFNELLAHQEMIGRQQEEMLEQQEEDARLEDEAYIEAKREAARASKSKKPLDKNALMKLRMNNSVEFSKWLAEEQIDVTSPNLDVEDFDAFLEKVKAKSAKKNAHSLDNESDHEHFEKTLQHSVQATILAGDALNALQPVELHAVTSTAATTCDISSTINYTRNTTTTTSRPFTPDFSSITSGGSSLTNTPLKHDDTEQDFFNVSSIKTDASFSSALSSVQSDAEATPTNKSDSTFIVADKTPVNNPIDLTTTPKTAVIDATPITTKAIINTPQSPKSFLNPTPQSTLSNTSKSPSTSANQTPKAFDSHQTRAIETPKTNGTIDARSSMDSSYSSPVASFKMVNNTNSTSKSKTNSNNTPSRAFDNSAFMEDFNTADSLSDDDDDDFGDFDTADGGFEELLT